ncbi:MAG TPA: nuclear transport factor 2 family protein [Actinomycetota bacterium]|nr:nuclear transport factor 2 family protein [Actinomycetota bacterium]
MAEDVVYHIPGEGPYVGREAVLAAWNRQAALLEEGDIEADLLDFAATGDHVFTYVEARGQIRGTGRPFSYTTVTVYRIRGDQIVEVRPHIHDLDAYDEFWSSVEPGTEAESEREEPAEATAAEQPRTEAEPGEG